MDEGRIRETVKVRVGAVAVPSRFVVVPALPETYSGKYMRRLLRAMVDNEPLGDLGVLQGVDPFEGQRLEDCYELVNCHADDDVPRADTEGIGQGPLDVSLPEGNIMIIEKPFTL